MRDFETAQREFLLKLEMAVYIVAAMVASSKHTFTPTKQVACEGHGCQHQHTPCDCFEQYCQAKFSGSTSDADGDSGEANATPSTSKAIWKEKGTCIVHVLKGDINLTINAAMFCPWKTGGHMQEHWSRVQ